MYSLLLNLCKRSLYRVSSSIRSSSKRLSHVANIDEEKRKVEIASTKFPDYKVIYVFPFIKQACTLNSIKYRATIFIGVATPVIIGLSLVNILSFDLAIASTATSIILTIWLYSLGILCDHLVAYIYFKMDEEKVIFSYIDYRGKRMDLTTSINDVIPISDNPISITDSLYRKIMFSSRKETLKINTKLGRIIDVPNFTCILGKV